MVGELSAISELGVWLNSWALACFTGLVLSVIIGSDVGPSPRWNHRWLRSRFSAPLSGDDDGRHCPLATAGLSLWCYRAMIALDPAVCCGSCLTRPPAASRGVGPQGAARSMHREMAPGGRRGAEAVFRHEVADTAHEAIGRR